jgi:hypothetical protein
MKVNEFEIETVLYTDTKVPIQYRGGGRTAAPKQFNLSLLLAWIQANLLPTGVSTSTVTAGATGLGLTAGKLLEKMVVYGSTTGTFSVGTTIGGTDILNGEAFDTNGLPYVVERFFKTGGTIFFSGFAGTLTVKLYFR